MSFLPPDPRPALVKRDAIALLEPECFRQLFGSREQELLESSLRWVTAPNTCDARLLRPESVTSTEVILASWGMPVMDSRFLERFPRLKIVFYAAGSVRSFVTEESWRRGVRVVSAGAANAISTAEFAFAAIILGLKQAWPQAMAMRRERRFVRNTRSIAGTYGSVVGLLGLGRIGRLVAGRLQALAVGTIAYDPTVAPEEAASFGVELCSLEEVFARADIVSCHLPLLPDTRGLVRGSHFRMMKPSAAFINTARGAVLAQEELVAVLRERPDVFAMLDVTDPEPLPPSSPLYELPNVVLTPHIAGCTGRECQRLGVLISDEIWRYVRGQPLEHEVTEELAAIQA